jgi:peptide deformylase
VRDLPIELLGSPLLRERAAEIAHFDDRLRELVEAMFRTMYRAQGQGLAGPQVGVLQRVIVVDMPDDESPAYALVNPVIVERGTPTRKFEEGCLSIPGVTAPVERSTRVVVEAFTPDGAPLRIEAEDGLADCLQHEIDHLDGVLYIDHLSHLQRQLLLKRYKRLAARREA